ncbi:enoyl-CoA hydratase [Sulfoacidibacillus thermotolerans]|uniref:Enoyl-CoA hydratase domain-containing protein 3, mitochondrial n=1 Tax=Sulfoacidibacillus thermotolerans TaxID=1765684 RepID=A0A2U3D6X8_SULT2|nr:enoyl-CoA hydratase [Sulfoacidibacillus thermotolerans]PWI57035.1 enoyl-CoA hydratase [Sulfoacidibacillus thermotolerans]
MRLTESVLHHESKIATITLNNPSKRNALSKSVLESLALDLHEIARDQNIHVVILKAHGPVFSSGHDLREIISSPSEEVLSLFQTCGSVMTVMREIPQIVIAEVQGIATAAGCQLVAASDLAVASTDARFATPGVKIGLFCSTPAVHLTRNVGRKKAAEMLFTGEFISATEALEHGLVNRLADPDTLHSSTYELAQTIAQYSLSTLSAGKRFLYQQYNMTDEQALSFATQVISLQSTTPDAKEGISAFLEKRPPQWR